MWSNRPFSHQQNLNRQGTVDAGNIIKSNELHSPIEAHQPMEFYLANGFQQTNFQHTTFYGNYPQVSLRKDGTYKIVHSIKPFEDYLKQKPKINRDKYKFVSMDEVNPIKDFCKNPRFTVCNQEPQSHCNLTDSFYSNENHSSTSLILNSVIQPHCETDLSSAAYP